MLTALVFYTNTMSGRIDAPIHQTLVCIYMCVQGVRVQMKNEMSQRKREVLILSNN